MSLCTIFDKQRNSVNGLYSTSLDHSELIWGSINIFKNAFARQIGDEKMILFRSFLDTIYTNTWLVEWLKDSFFAIADGIRSNANTMTIATRKKFEKERWYDKIEAFLREQWILPHRVKQVDEE